MAREERDSVLDPPGSKEEKEEKVLHRGCRVGRIYKKKDFKSLSTSGKLQRVYRVTKNLKDED
jgi:hypothetical protein